MPVIVTPRYGIVRVPPDVSDLAAFRRWVHSAHLPEKLPVHFLRGDVWIDCDRADSLANILIRGELTAVLANLVRAGRAGDFVPAGVLWSNDRAGFATLPDGFFFTRDSLKSGRVRFSNGGRPKAHATEVIGTPDVVIEIVSDVSEEKDTEWLRADYSTAGVPEYWLIDAREEEIRFDVLVKGQRGYRANGTINGWVRSKVFQKAFRLIRSEDQHELPEFTLETG